MKRMLCLLVCFLLICPHALAETTAERAYVARGGLLTLNRLTGTLTSVSRSGSLTLLASDGSALCSQSFAVLREDEAWPVLHAVPLSDADTLYAGLLSAQGEWLVPPEYDAVTVLSDRWAVAVRMRPAMEGERVEYQNGDSVFVTERADLYYRREKVVSLQPDQFYAPYAAYNHASGDYAAVIGPAAVGSWFNKRGEITAAITEDVDLQEWNGVYHVPSGLDGFVPGCRLDEDEVACALFYDEFTGEVVELDGDVRYTVDGSIVSSFAFDRFEGEYLVLACESQRVWCVYSPCGEHALFSMNSPLMFGGGRAWGEQGRFDPSGFITGISISMPFTFLARCLPASGAAFDLTLENVSSPAVGLGCGVVYPSASLSMREKDYFFFAFSAPPVSFTSAPVSGLSYAPDALAFLTESHAAVFTDGTGVLPDVDALSFDGRVALCGNQVYLLRAD